jgi:hypothetical protein
MPEFSIDECLLGWAAFAIACTHALLMSSFIEISFIAFKK